jgi:hypothetical protein
MLDHIRENRAALLGSYSNADEILKGKGEGSKGGKVVGHTKSGKAIYDKHDHHKMMAGYHEAMSKKFHDKADDFGSSSDKGVAAEGKEHRKTAEWHEEQREKHKKAADNEPKNPDFKKPSEEEALAYGKKHGADEKPKDEGYEDTGEGAHVKKEEKPEKKAEPKEEKKEAKPAEKKPEAKKEDKKIEKSDNAAGGKKIGKTKSGKDVYDDPDHKEHKEFTSQDHRDAADLHHSRAADSKNGFPGKSRSARNKHLDAAAKTGKKEEKEAIKAQPGAGDIVTSKDGVRGEVKHRDETHTYIEHEAGEKKKVSKVPNDHLDGYIKSGEWTHHKVANQKKDDIKKSDEWDATTLLKAHDNYMAAKISDTIMEKGGEGSKGGKVIGHTKSGKPIYETFTVGKHKNQSEKDPMHKHHGTFSDDERHEAFEVTQKLKKEKTKAEVEASRQKEGDKMLDHYKKLDKDVDRWLGAGIHTTAAEDRDIQAKQGAMEDIRKRLRKHLKEKGVKFDDNDFYTKKIHDYKKHF